MLGSIETTLASKLSPGTTTITTTSPGKNSFSNINNNNSDPLLISIDSTSAPAAGTAALPSSNKTNHNNNINNISNSINSNSNHSLNELFHRRQLSTGSNKSNCNRRSYHNLTLKHEHHQQRQIHHSHQQHQLQHQISPPHQQQSKHQLIEQEPPAEQLYQSQEQRLHQQQQQVLNNNRQQQQQPLQTHEQLLQHLRFNDLDNNSNKLTSLFQHHNNNNNNTTTNNNNHHSASNHHHHHHHPYQKQQLSSSQGTTTQRATSPFPFQLAHYTPEQQELLQVQHELFQKQLQLQQQQTEKLIATMKQQLQQQQQQQQQLHHHQLEQDADSQQEFKICLRESAFGMSDKSSTTNSLPNSPVHTTVGSLSNNNGSLMNTNNNGVVAAVAAAAAAAVAVNNNNNNTSSTNRNVVADDDSCFRMDTEVTYSDKEPDPDNIKMFVGQVPKSMDEAQLREMFEEYGPVHSINVLRDKATGISKGCCFVTFYTRRAALKAQDALHNVKTLNGMYHPIQMKPADSENRNERKLFVGMLNKKLNENDVRKLFEVHGAIEECTVLRDQNGQSKGCAFVTFSTKHAAISAIKVTLNQNKIMEGCTSPLVVKFADTQKEKEQKKIQQIQANLWNLASNINIPLGQAATTVSTPILPNPPQQPSPVLGADAITPASLQLLQQLQAVGLQQQLLQGLTAQQSNNSEAAVAAAGLLPPMTVQNLAALAAMTSPALTNAATNPGTAQLTNTAALLCLLGKTAANTGESFLTPSPCNELQQNQKLQQQQQHQQHHHHQQQQQIPPPPPPQQPQHPLFDLDAFSFPWSDPNSLASAYMSTAAAALPQFGSAAALTSPLATVALSAAAAAAAGKQIEGPEGCNLFIYHLPQEFTDTDLASTFLPFGNVISAKVFIDKQTSLSKCFGFVSFDNPDSAQVAIKAMNGFQVGTKRLKVQLKKPKDASKPY